MVTVKLYASLRPTPEEKEFTSAASTVEEALEEAVRRFGPAFRERLTHAIVLVNGRHTAHLNRKKIRLKPGDTVSLFPPLAGG